MQCYTEVTLPSAVTHSLSLPFLSASANNLVVAKSSLLQIFSLKSVVNQTGGPQISAEQLSSPATTKPQERAPTTKLVLIAQYELSGTITSLARVKILNSKSGAEALLVSLKDAKLSLVEWDPQRFSISTVSIHYYEREDLLNNPWESDLSQCSNYLSVDPGSRCAALKFGARHLAVLPFHQVGDDLVMADDFDGELDREKSDKDQAISDSLQQDTNQTPYAASFVLSLLALDPALTHPVHLGFLYEYREPTFGILYSSNAPSSALLHERKDNMCYAVYTIDIEQRESTTLLSVNKLPYDLHTIVPLSRIVGGVLLVGHNEIIHVDQSGKTSGVAVNGLAKLSTSFAMADQAELAMKLEGCVVKQLGVENPDVLLILNTGELALVSFVIDGRSVSRVSTRRVSNENGGNSLTSGASCASIIGRGRMFVGSEEGNSTILGWSRASDRLKRQPSQTDMETLPTEEDAFGLDGDDMDDDDDLYSGDKIDTESSKQAQLLGAVPGESEYIFRIHDSMLNVAPLRDPTSVIRSRSQHPYTGDSYEFVATSGQGKDGGISSLCPNVHLNTQNQYEIFGCRAAWAVRPKAPSNDGAANDFDRYLITSNEQEESQVSKIFSIQGEKLEEVIVADFEPDAGELIEIDILNDGNRIVSVSSFEVRTYDQDLSLAQIFPLTDEDSSMAPPAVSASFAEPYVLIIRRDGSLMVLIVDESGDLDEIEQGSAIKNVKWSSGSFYEDSNDVFRLEFGEEEDEASNVLAFLLSSSGGLHVFRLPNLQVPVFTAEGLTFLPPFLTPEFSVRRSSAREMVLEILVAEIGDSVHKSPYLILRSFLDDITIYQPYQSPIAGSKDTKLNFLKVSNSKVSRVDHFDSFEDGTFAYKNMLRPVQDQNGYDIVSITGPSSGLIIKAASSQPQLFNFPNSRLRQITSIRTQNCPCGMLIVIEKGEVHVSTLPLNADYSTGWVITSLNLGCTVEALAYHSSSDTLVLGTSTPHPFKLPEDDYHHEQRAGEETSPFPLASHGHIKLLDHKTSSVIASEDLDPYETVMCIETANLEVSEITHERQDLVAIGTAVIRGEDLPALGRVYIYAIIPVVPKPDRPETGRALKLISKEEVRGVVSSICGVGTQGFLLMAQGQKCMVRGLKEDGSFLPVAFMDMQCYVSVVKELKGTEGLCLMGDLVKGLWVTGYMEDPYQLRLFGKSYAHLEVLAADFLPDGDQLYLIVADGEGNLHILQFDPDNPKSLSGTRLLHHSTFHTGHFPTSLTLLPPVPSYTSPFNPNDQRQEEYSESPTRKILLTTSSGALALLCPLPQDTHRTLTSLSSHAITNLTHPLALNPRAFRYGNSAATAAAAAVDVANTSAGAGGGGTGGGRFGGGVGGSMGVGTGSVVDGMVVRRWGEAGRWKTFGAASSSAAPAPAPTAAAASNGAGAGGGVDTQGPAASTTMGASVGMGLSMGTGMGDGWREVRRCVRVATTLDGV